MGFFKAQLKLTNMFSLKKIAFLHFGVNIQYEVK